MSDNNGNMRNTKNNRKEDGKFNSKKIKHDPQAESARAVFGLKGHNYQNTNDDKTSTF